MASYMPLEQEGSDIQTVLQLPTEVGLLQNNNLLHMPLLIQPPNYSDRILAAPQSQPDKSLVPNPQSLFQMPGAPQQPVQEFPPAQMSYIQTAQMGQPQSHPQLSVEVTSDLNSKQQLQQQQQQQQQLQQLQQQRQQLQQQLLEQEIQELLQLPQLLLQQQEEPLQLQQQQQQWQQQQQLLQEQWQQPQTQGLQDASQQPLQFCEDQTPQGNFLIDDVMAIIKQSSEADPEVNVSMDSLLRKLAEADAQLTDDPNKCPYNPDVTMATTVPTNSAQLLAGPPNAMLTTSTNQVASPGSSGAVGEMPLVGQAGGVGIATVPTTTNLMAQPSPPYSPPDVSATSTSVAMGTTMAASPSCTPSSSTTETNKSLAVKTKTKGAKPKKPRAKRQTGTKAKKDDNQSSLETETKKAKTTAVIDEKTNEKQLSVSLHFQSQLLLEDVQVNSSDGCVVFHKNPWQFQDASVDFTKIKFPEVDKDKHNLTPKQIEATGKLLDAMNKGIHIYVDDDGNIFARRFCRSGVICYSTMPGDEGFQPVFRERNNLDHKKDRYFMKLEQDKKVKVFDKKKFTDHLKYYAVINKIESVPCPVIYFTFGQQWEPGKPLSNCLVYFKVIPKKARYDRCALNKGEDESFECDAMALALSNMSLSSGQGGHSDGLKGHPVTQ